MKKISVHALPLEEVMVDLGRSMNVEVDQDCKLYSLHIPEEFGEGRIWAIQLSDDMGMIHYDCRFSEDVEIVFDSVEIHPLKFLYCMIDGVKHRFLNSDDIHNMGLYQTGIIASSKSNGHVLYFEKDTPIMLNSLEIDRVQFHKDYECEIQTLIGPLKHLFEDVEAHDSFYHESQFSLKFWDLLKEIDESDREGIHKRLFLQAKADEMLALNISEFVDDQSGESGRKMLRKGLVELIRRAADLIREDLSNPRNISDLAREVGTNPNKLQDGFRQVYGSSIHDFLKKVRMEHTRDLLRTTDYSIGEIVHMVGLVNHGYHSGEFKKHYGMTPKEYRRKIHGENTHPENDGMG